MKYCQLVVGPAGSGKSTYCYYMQLYLNDSKRFPLMINFDPAAESFKYQPDIDIRELINIDDLMGVDSLGLGPNGSLIACLEYLTENLEWIEDRLGDTDEDYIIVDCPGQIELYTHLGIMPSYVAFLRNNNYNVCTVFVTDVQTMMDSNKFIGGLLASLSTMFLLETSQINILSKADLITPTQKEQLDSFISPCATEIHNDLNKMMDQEYHKLNSKLAELIDDFGLLNFYVLDYENQESLSDILHMVDLCLQFGDDAEVKENCDEPEE